MKGREDRNQNTDEGTEDKIRTGRKAAQTSALTKTEDSEREKRRQRRHCGSISASKQPDRQVNGHNREEEDANDNTTKEQFV